MAYQDVRSFYEEPDVEDPKPIPFSVDGRWNGFDAPLVHLIRLRCSRCSVETDVEAEPSDFFLFGPGNEERPEAHAVYCRCLVCGDQWGQWRPLGWLAQQRYTVEAA